MIQTAVEVGYINDEDAKTLHEWREDPFAWGANHGCEKVEK